MLLLHLLLLKCLLRGEVSFIGCRVRKHLNTNHITSMLGRKMRRVGGILIL